MDLIENLFTNKYILLENYSPEKYETKEALLDIYKKLEFKTSDELLKLINRIDEIEIKFMDSIICCVILLPKLKSDLELWIIDCIKSDIMVFEDGDKKTFKKIYKKVCRKVKENYENKSIHMEKIINEINVLHLKCISSMTYKDRYEKNFTEFNNSSSALLLESVIFILNSYNNCLFVYDALLQSFKEYQESYIELKKKFIDITKTKFCTVCRVDKPFKEICTTVCQHTVCFVCLVGLYKNNSMRSIFKCPYCRKKDNIYSNISAEKIDHILKEHYPNDVNGGYISTSSGSDISSSDED